MTSRSLRRVLLLLTLLGLGIALPQALRAQFRPSALVGTTCGNNAAAFGTAPIATGTSFECDFTGGALAAGQSVVYAITSPAGTTFQTVGGAFPAGCTSNAGPTATLTVTCSAGLPGAIQRGLGLNGGATAGTVNFTANYNGAGAAAVGPFNYQFDAFAGTAAVSPFAGTAAPSTISCVNVTAPGTQLKVGQTFSCTVSYPAAQTPSFVTVTPAGGSAAFTPTGTVSSTRPGATSGYACGASNPSPGSACASFSFGGSFSAAGAFPANFSLASFALGAEGAYSTVALVPSVAFGSGGFTVAPATASTTTTLSVSPSPAAPGQPVTLTATVSATRGGTPTGTVTFLDGATTLGTATLGAGGTATFTTTLPAGTHSLTASYGGDAANAASTSAAVSLVVLAAPPGGTGTGPSQAALGCAISNLATDIAFPTTTGGTLLTGGQVASPGAPLSAGAIVPGTLSVTSPFGVVECGAVFEDTPAPAGTFGLDGDPSTIAGGSITFTLSSGVATILESNSTTYSIGCGSDQAPSTVSPGGLESCQGAVLLPSAACVAALNCTFATPNPANIVHVGLLSGATFPLIGAGSPVVTLSATYIRFPSLSAAVGASGPATLSTNSVTIGIAVPTYASQLVPNPATISSAAGAQGSVLTMSLFHLATACTAVNGIVTLTPQVANGLVVCGNGVNLIQQFVAGAESGVVTFTTSSGVLGNTTLAQGGGQQTYSVHCGALPATTPTILIPTLGLASTFALTSCQSATATLFGGGNAGTAVVVANFVGDFTGGTTQSSTTVQLAINATTALTRGCNEVITGPSTALAPVSGSVSALVTNLVSPSSNVVSVWRFNNSTHAFEAGFFNTAGAPTDFSTVSAGQSIFICVSGSATFNTQ